MGQFYRYSIRDCPGVEELLGCQITAIAGDLDDSPILQALARWGEPSKVLRTKEIRSSGSQGFSRKMTLNPLYSASASGRPLITMTGIEGLKWRSCRTNSTPFM